MGLIPGFEGSLEKSRETHSRLLAWRLPWTEEPGGLQSTGSHRVRCYWRDLAHMHARHITSGSTWPILRHTPLSNFQTQRT